MPTRIVLITGTSRGIGRAMAEYYLDQGDTVIGCSRSDAVQLGTGYVHHSLDLFDEVTVRSMFADIRRRYGRLDILINNAGVGLAALAIGTSLSSAESVLRINLLGTVLCCREAVKIMMKVKMGRIINISSIAVATNMEGASVYSASKAAVEQYTRVLAKEVATLGITCNVVVPSLVETDMLRSLSEGAKEKYISAMTIKRPATMDDMINAIEFFTRAESGAITGQRLALSCVG